MGEQVTQPGDQRRTRLFPRQRIAHLALLLLALAAASLPAAAPFLIGEGLPRTNDALPHLFRVVALDRMVQAGQLLPRWSPDLVHGYGYPVFNFVPPLSHWLVEAIHLLGPPVTAAYRIAVFVHFWLAAAGAFFLGRHWFGHAAGWVAALAYIYSPYLLYDAHVRGGLPESQALALLPWLWLGLAQAADGKRRWIAFAALAFAAAFLSHFPVMFQATLLLGIWMALGTWRAGWHWLAGPVLGIGLGILLTAFFWLPALTEIGYTQATRSISQGYAYTDNFLSLRQLLAWPHIPADPALINPPVVRALPTAALVLAGAGFLWAWRRLHGERRRQAQVWLVLLLVSVWLVTPASRLVWEYLPFLSETLYPWRFLGMASLAAAILLGIPMDLIWQQTGHSEWLLAAVTAVLVIAAVPWLYPPREAVSADPKLGELLQFEMPPLFIGTTTLGEFLPRWVEELPDTSALRSEHRASGDAERLLPADGVHFQRRGGPAWDSTYDVTVEKATVLTYRQFYFPGWRATLDGEPIPIEPSVPEGLITFRVPAGSHALQLTFGSTPARTAGWAVSALGAAGMLLVGTGTTFVWRRRARLPERSSMPAAPRWLLPLSGLVVVVWLFFTFVDTPLRQSTLSQTSVASRPEIEPLDFAGEIRLLSFESPEEPVGATDPIPVTLSFRALRPIGVPYLIGVDVVDDRGLVWTAERERPPDWRFVGGSELWPMDGYRIEPFVLRLLDGTPPGSYRFRIGLVREDIDHTVALHETGALMIATPARGNATLEEGMMAQEASAASGVRLLGSRPDRTEAAPGDPVRLALLWQVADKQLAGDSGPVVIRLQGADGRTAVSLESPLAGGYAPSRWQEGDRLRTELLLRLPASVPSGEFTWHASLAGAGEDTSWTIGHLRVQAPERRYITPATNLDINLTLGDIATLLGATLQPENLNPGGMLGATLVWRAEAETDTSYRVFLHLLGPEAEVISQSDGEPAGWTRPTTGWLPGEIVVDERELQLPPQLAAGTYTLLAGLYQVETGLRLRTANGDDAVTLTTFRINAAP
jgi:hypothetical protein